MWNEENNQLQKIFKFDNFDEAWKFLEKVAQLSKEMNHHPWWSNEYNKVEIRLSTHEAGNTITDKDRLMAECIDQCI
ncbi:MAG: 4a-hydroxytetrahydrobiopterin dehydratase [Candidatus Paceibacteria bacterium]|jgi:4a-hydroxytetrahydrobiopterin dehydratase